MIQFLANLPFPPPPFRTYLWLFRFFFFFLNDFSFSTRHDVSLRPDFSPKFSIYISILWFPNIFLVKSTTCLNGQTGRIINSPNLARDTTPRDDNPITHNYRRSDHVGVLNMADCLTINARQYNVGDNDIDKKYWTKKNYVGPFWEMGSAINCKEYISFFCQIPISINTWHKK